MKKNLRRFVAAKVFPGEVGNSYARRICWENVCCGGISKNYITLPPSFTKCQLADCYSKVVQTNLIYPVTHEFCHHMSHQVKNGVQHDEVT